jgi:hypothetical protein
MNQEDIDHLRKIVKSELQDIERECEHKRTEERIQTMQRNTRLIAYGAIAVAVLIYTLMLSECSARRVFSEYEHLLRPAQTK